MAVPALVRLAVTGPSFGMFYIVLASVLLLHPSQARKKNRFRALFVMLRPDELSEDIPVIPLKATVEFSKRFIIVLTNVF